MWAMCIILRTRWAGRQCFPSKSMGNVGKLTPRVVVRMGGLPTIEPASVAKNQRRYGRKPPARRDGTARSAADRRRVLAARGFGASRGGSAAETPAGRAPVPIRAVVDETSSRR
ncbi:hypothetical protein GCM10010381_40860 [Streptomyces xantholiticus]|nr:hypothetical protein GCM10010381_40860 [Streptomyces xantholiticus]